MKRIFIAIFILSTSLVNAKMFERKIHTIESEERPNLNQRWVRLADSDEESLVKLVALLAQSTTGKQIISAAAAKAKAQGQTLSDVLIVGESSLTDTTLVRRFVPA